MTSTDPRAPWRRRLALGACALLAAFGAQAACGDSPSDRPVYLAFDTGSMNEADAIAEVLNRHAVRATIFVADEPLASGGSSLDDDHAPWWRARAAEGHAFGARVAPAVPGRAYCNALSQTASRFHALTGRVLPKIVHTADAKPAAAAAEACGWTPVVASARVIDATPPGARRGGSPRFERTLHAVRAGEILQARLGSAPRRAAWAPANLEPLIAGLEARGFCFATLREHPAYRAEFAW